MYHQAKDVNAHLPFLALDAKHRCELVRYEMLRAWLSDGLYRPHLSGIHNEASHETGTGWLSSRKLCMAVQE